MKDFANPIENFTNQYSLSKTLRFELKPIGKDGKRLSEEESNKLFEEILDKDRKIKAAYIALKPVMDKIHEDIINKSLTSDEAKNIKFSEYFEEYKKGKDKNLDKFEKILREEIGKTFEKTANEFADKENKQNEEIEKNKASENPKKKKIKEQKPIFKKDKKDKDVGVKYLTQAGILKYIENNIKNLVSEENIKEFFDEIEITEKGKKEVKKIGHLATFSKFFTYFSGYNQNRENYYFSEKEKSTAVPTRIVHENLPRFCDNIIQFLERKNDYLKIIQCLKDKGITTQIKDSKINAFIETNKIDEDFFKIEDFYKYFFQTGIEEYNKATGSYNYLVNLFNQNSKSERDFLKLKPFKTLNKQIGCGEKKALIDVLKYDTQEEQEKANEASTKPLNLNETLKLVNNSGEKYFRKSTITNDINIYSFVEWLKHNDNWDGVYWSKIAIDKISNRYLGNWHEIKDRIQAILQSKDKTQKELLKSVASYDKKREEQLKINDAVELSGLFKILDQEQGTNWSKSFFRDSILEERKSLIDENSAPSKNLINLICKDMEDLAEEFCDGSNNILSIGDYKNENNILAIKKWLDKAKSALWVVKYFEVKESKAKGNSINPELTNMLSALLNAKDADWFNWYDLIRNYLTKKPQEDAKKNKLKLNFGKGNLLDGFVESLDNNGTQYGGYILRKINREYKEKTGEEKFDYFIGISQNQKLFRCNWDLELKQQKSESGLSEFQRLNYYQLNPRKENSILKKFILQFIDGNQELTKKVEKHFKEKYTNARTCVRALKEEFQIHFEGLLNDNSFSLKNYDFSEDSPKFKLYRNKQYNTFYDLFHDIRKKEFKYLHIKDQELSDVLDVGRNFYLFKIYNKDLSFVDTFANGLRTKPMGNKNLHTQYFECLMNGDQNFIDIGSGEIFFRDSIKDYKKIIHKVGEKIVNKREKETEKTIPHDVHRELFSFSNKRKSIEELSEATRKYLDKDNKIDESRVVVKNVKYDITKDKRFTEKKYQLHLSTILNFNPENKNINDEVNKTFTEKDDIQFLGIDRGEKHLIYYSIVDAKGKIIKQDHFDIINKKNYLEEINEAAKRRREKQENWQQKGNISNLKDGYISLVVHEIIQKMKDENGNYKPTFIVLEDLSTGFKRSRQKFEQQVYQKFELALAKKLNYLVDKKAKMGDIGSVSAALQLTPLITNYGDIKNRKQVGVMLYTRANYTSVTDPVTGWRKTIYLKKGSEEIIKKQIIEAFDEIGMDLNGDYFFQYKDKNTNKIWTLWSSKNGKSLERYRGKRGKDKNEYVIEPFDTKGLLDKLFEKFDKSKSLKQQINNRVELQKANEHTAWEGLRFVIDTIQQIRNSGDVAKGQKDNFLLSPIRDDAGGHFDSRIYEEQKSPNLPKDADANGAYNIARKGIIMYEHIKQWVKDGEPKFKTESKKEDKKDKKELSDLDLFISDKEWDLWTTN